MTSIVPTQRYETEDFQFDIEVVAPFDFDAIHDHERREVALAMQELDNQIDA